MKKQSLNFFGIFVLLIVILLGVFVLAALAPTNLKFAQNTTLNYDADGTVHLNWTNGTTDAGNNTYVIYIQADDIFFTSANNDSAKGFIFTNTTDANYTFTVESNNGTTKTNSSKISIIVDTTNPVKVIFKVVLVRYTVSFTNDVEVYNEKTKESLFASVTETLTKIEVKVFENALSAGVPVI